jgi:hypothetical protein
LKILHVASEVEPWSLSTFALDAISSGVPADHFVHCSHLAVELPGVRWVRESRYRLWSAHRTHEVARLAAMVEADVVHVHDVPQLLARLVASRALSVPLVASVGFERSSATARSVLSLASCVLRSGDVSATLSGPLRPGSSSALFEKPDFCYRGVVEPAAVLSSHVSCRVALLTTGSSTVFQEQVAAELGLRGMVDPVLVRLDRSALSERDGAELLRSAATIESADIVVVPAVPRREVAWLMSAVVFAQAAGCCLLVADRSPMSSSLRRGSVAWVPDVSPVAVAAATAALLADHQRRGVLRSASHAAAVNAWKDGSVVDAACRAYNLATGAVSQGALLEHRLRGEFS